MKLNHAVPDVAGDVATCLKIAKPQRFGKPYAVPPKIVAKTAVALVREEMQKELMPHLEQLEKGVCSMELLEKIMDDIVDSVVVLNELAHTLCLPFNAHWNHVQERNLAKFQLHNCDAEHGCGGSGTIHSVRYNKEVDWKCSEGGRIVLTDPDSGKYLKPDDWTEPDSFQVLHEYWMALAAKEQPDLIDGHKHRENLPPERT